MLKIENLTKKFGNRVILDRISLTLEEGKTVAIFGESGSGKTTLLNIVSTLLSADEGSLVLNEQRYSEFRKKKKEAYRIANFAYISPEANLLSPLSGKENILFPLELQKISFSEDDFKPIEEKLKLTPFLNESVDTLSSGEQQRIVIARALTLKKRVLIADEPTSHLDAELASVVMDLIEEEAKKNGTIVLCSCHDRSLLGKFDEVYFLENGVLSKNEKTA